MTMGRMRLFFKVWLGASLRLMMTLLSANLLYLYFAGGWHDPCRFIEIVELVMLALMVVVGIVWLIVYLGRTRRELGGATGD